MPTVRESSATYPVIRLAKRVLAQVAAFLLKTPGRPQQKGSSGNILTRSGIQLHPFILCVDVRRDFYAVLS